MANNKVKFLRGTSDKYAVAEKDSDAIYFTTDDGKLYIGDKEVSGGSNITIDDKLSNTSTNPVQNKVINSALASKAASSHNQASNTITAMTGYSKPSSTSAIAAGDSLNTAIGKLEKALDAKGTSNLTIGTTASTAAAGNHTHSSYVNQNAFSNVVVGSTTVAADTATDTLTLVGSNVTLTPDATNDKVTIEITKANVTSALGYTPSNTKSATITLTTSRWSSNSQTVSSSIVTSSNIIIVSPIPSNQDLYSNCGVKCTSQSSGSLVFTCDATPDSDISVNIVVL